MKSIIYVFWIFFIILFAEQTSKTQVTLEKSGSRYTFTFNPLFFAVDTNRGGRIVSLQYDGTELLYLQSVQDMNGSTFWPSPQSLWGWPPLPNIDNKAYGAKLTSNKLLLTSKVDPGLHIRVYKSFAIDPTDTSIIINYYIKNEGTTPISLAPWEITRVPLNGPVIFKLEDGQVTGTLASETTVIDTHVWYDQQNTQGSGSKFFANGNGWIAYINTNQKLIFLKKFRNIAAESAAPSEAEVEVYTSGDRKYTEIENQGPYTNISAKDSMVYTVRWAVRTIPANIPVTIGDTSLTNYIDDVANRLRLADTLIFNDVTSKISIPKRTLEYAVGQITLNNFSTSDFPLQVSIFDALGKKVWQKRMEHPQPTISVPSLPQGIYFLYLLDNQQRRETAKIVIQKSL